MTTIYSGHPHKCAKPQNIKQNILRTGAYGVEAVHGEMPGCLESLPDPDRIFIGGGMGKDNKVLEETIKRLKPAGRLVLHLVLMGSLTRAGDYLKGLNRQYAITHVQVSRSKSTAGDQRLEAMNPVYILSAAKPVHGPFVEEEHHGQGFRISPLRK